MRQKQKRALAEKVKGELQNSEKHVSIHLAQEINADTVLTQVCSPYSKKLVSGKLRNTVKNILRKNNNDKENYFTEGIFCISQSSRII